MQCFYTLYALYLLHKVYKLLFRGCPVFLTQKRIACPTQAILSIILFLSFYYYSIFLSFYLSIISLPLPLHPRWVRNGRAVV
mgnify:CR=1 FL=1